MDFASALEDLERTADAASSGGRGGGNNNNNNSSRHHHHQARDNHSSSNSHHHHHPRGNGNDRRRGRSEDYSTSSSHHHPSNRRNQRPRYNNQGGGGGGNSNHHHYHHQSRGYSSERSGGRGGGRHHHGHHGSGGGPPPPGNPLEGMRRFGYRVEEPPTVKAPETMGTPERPFHIALLAICIDGLPYEHLWRAWAAAGAANDNASCHTQVSLLVHAKKPRQVQSEFLKQRLLVHPPKLGRGNSYADPEYVTHRPNWGSVEITKAMLDLMREALVIGTPNDREKDARFSKQRYHMNNNSNKDGGVGDGSFMTTSDATAPLPPVDKFIFISETCVPVATLAETQQALFGSPDLYHATSSSPALEEPKITPWHMSWVHGRNRNTDGTPRNKYERDQFGDIFRMVPGQYRWKADQWMVLSRPHASAVANIDAHLPPQAQLWNSFSKISASDEMYFPTALAVLQIIQDPKVVSRLRERQQQQKSGSMDGKSGKSSEDVGEELDHKKDEESGDKNEGDFKEENGAAADDAETTTETKKPGPTVESLSPAVLFKSVTYTDWSEGMRNPKSFFRGPSDLRTVSQLARQQGSIFARKFILCPPTDDSRGKDPQDLSGYISVEDWKQVLESSAPLASIHQDATKEEE